MQYSKLLAVALLSVSFTLASPIPQPAGNDIQARSPQCTDGGGITIACKAPAAELPVEKRAPACKDGGGITIACPVPKRALVEDAPEKRTPKSEEGGGITIAR